MKAQRRARNTALAGAAIHAVVTLGMLAVGLWTGSRAAISCTWFVAGGVAVWLMVALLFYCRQLERQEAVELEELAAEHAAGTIFKDERELSLRPAAGRRRFVERWLVPIFSLLWAGYHVGIGLLVLVMLGSAGKQPALPALAHVGPGILFSVLLGLAAFLFSRYATGMSTMAAWQPLRAAASFLLVGVLAVGAVLAAFVAAWWGYRTPDAVVAYALPIAQFALAAELLVSLLLDVYRPRVPGEPRRLTFDSRLCNLLAEPGKVGHSIAETLNYQFGFEVSGTWFYRLLSKALLPLIVFGAIMLVLMSSVVIVYEGHQCVVLHWGRKDAGRVLSPGIHLKWPWPVDTAEHFDVRKIHEVLLGAGEKREPIRIRGREIMLWTTRHGRYEELDFLVAIPPEQRGVVRRLDPATQPAGGREQVPPPVNIIKLVVSVQYRIEDVFKFAYRFTNAHELFADAAYREMVLYCASATLDTRLAGGAANRPQAIMTSGWGPAAEALGQRVQKAVGAGGLDLGVRIANVKFLSVHPPPDAAPAFEAVLEAERKQDQLRYQAEGEANRTLSRVAGDPIAALELALAIRRLEELESLANLRGDAGEFAKELRRFLRNADENLKMLTEEIARDDLLGKLNTGKRRLAQRYAEHLATLQAIRAAGARFDFSTATDGARAGADDLFDRAVGEPAEKVAAAVAYRWTKEMDERAPAEAFQKELLAYRASPNMYRLDRWLDVWDEALPKMAKYVLGVDPNRIEVWLNWEQRRAGLAEDAFQGEGASPE